MNINDDQPSFHLVTPAALVEPPYHICGHYHYQYDNCPAGRCGSYLCCQPGDVEADTGTGVVDLNVIDAPNDGVGSVFDVNGVYDDEDPAPAEDRAPYGMCAKCWTPLPLIGHAGLTACCNVALIYI